MEARRRGGAVAIVGCTAARSSIHDVRYLVRGVHTLGLGPRPGRQRLNSPRAGHRERQQSSGERQPPSNPTARPGASAASRRSSTPIVDYSAGTPSHVRIVGIYPVKGCLCGRRPILQEKPAAHCWLNEILPWGHVPSGRRQCFGRCGGFDSTVAQLWSVGSRS